MSIKNTLFNLYINKHNSCGGCKKRWTGMRNALNIKQAPQFLQKKAQHDVDAMRLMNTLFKDKQYG
jgi:hypothetical protein